MLKRKDLENTLKKLDTYIGDEPDKYDTPNNYQLKRALVSKYMNKPLFDKQLLDRLKAVEQLCDRPKYAHEFLEQVLDYKIKQATKHGRKLNNDPRSRALVDISDCLVNSGKKERDMSKYQIGKQYGGYSYGQTKDTLVTRLTFKGNVCIPFDNCYVYTCTDDMGCIIDIKTNDDGTYSGTLYYLFSDLICIQSKFILTREETCWSVVIEVSKMQRPLGYPMSNIGAILSMLIFGDFEKFRNYFDVEDKNIIELPQLFNSSLSRMLLDALYYLGTYKSKYVYKLTQEDHTMYCYTTELGDHVQEYMREHYPNYMYEKLDGWIVNGYWKILKDKQPGTDKNGKSVRGYTWVTPYEGEEIEQVTSGEQQSNLMPIHAIKRAKERYKVDLTLHDLQEITKMCIEGKEVTKLTIRDKFGRLPKKDYKNNYTCYRLKYRNKYMDVVFEHLKDNARISTFLPAPKEPNYPIIDSAVYNKILQDVKR